MPIACKPAVPRHSPKPFFTNLSQLDAWASEPKGNPRTVLPFVPRNPSDDPYGASRGKLLVCHDFKGGYIESPFSLSYTFNFWSTIDIFVYFSHNRVTIPPPSWINAAHRHGVKMLGVLIFEHREHLPDLVRLLSGPDFALEIDPSTPSHYYSCILADLAHQRGFDGFLLNFELSLPGRATQARALAKWVRQLREELWKKVGPHAEVIWYDSVTTTGYVRYQNKLNEWNLPFFLSSTGLFTNYFWKENHPFETAEYLYSLDPNTLFIEKDNPSPSETPTHSLTHRDIYIGIDVWGRGSIGGGGFRVHKALEAICPDSLGLSAAIFGQGWTWEKKQDEAGRTWKAWWDEEVTLWTGKASGLDLNKLLGCDFRPIGDFFVKKPPPDPKALPFFTTLCPGVGKGWWVAGGKVWDGPEGDDQRWTSGWLDIEKCYSIGDSLWPVPTVVRDENVQGDTPLSGAALPTAQVSINLSNAWNGGSSVQLSFSEPEPAKPEQVPGDRSFWVPVQPFSFTPEENYTATAAYKLDKVEKDVVVGVRLEIRRFMDDVYGVPKGIYQDELCPLGRGWSGLQTSIRIHANDNTPIIPVELALGLRFNVKGCASANQHLFSLLLGQVTVNASQQYPQVAKRIAVDFNGEESVPKTSGLEGLDGILTWREIASVAEPTSPYRFAYWNVYVSPLTPSGIEDKEQMPGNAMWIGTSGVEDAREGELGRFAVTGRNLMRHSTSSGKLGAAEKLRFYVQAVAECGETGGGNTSSYVDVGIKQPT